MNIKFSLLLCAALAVTGCSTPKDWVATDGSKAHGTVTLAYEYSSLQSPETKQYQQETVAREKCQAWGYKDAKAFGGGEKICTDHSITGLCETYRVTVQMQCIGGFSYQY